MIFYGNSLDLRNYFKKRNIKFPSKRETFLEYGELQYSVVWVFLDSVKERKTDLSTFSPLLLGLLLKLVAYKKFTAPSDFFLFWR